MRKKLLILAILSVTGFKSYSKEPQTIIKQKIILTDSLTKERLVGVKIKTNTNKIFYSNLDGEFIINKEEKDTVLIINSISYKTKTIKMNDMVMNVNLSKL